ncbi:hypothetical protein sm9_0994 [Methanobrevibacter millerae]|uniref:Uncharacterized protein n=1 Tax=Methanobrevibacter millerae TaxID=230361 RepID=A0A0U3CSZ0_9EURY|nr:hypothetical protein sm9_0994 [Methanobrevibacter millerae]
MFQTAIALLTQKNMISKSHEHYYAFGIEYIKTGFLIKK